MKILQPREITLFVDLLELTFLEELEVDRLFGPHEYSQKLHKKQLFTLYLYLAEYSDIWSVLI